MCFGCTQDRKGHHLWMRHLKCAKHYLGEQLSASSHLQFSGITGNRKGSSNRFPKFSEMTKVICVNYVCLYQLQHIFEKMYTSFSFLLLLPFKNILKISDSLLVRCIQTTHLLERVYFLLAISGTVWISLNIEHTTIVGTWMN